jgi:hypothetical protein
MTAASRLSGFANAAGAAINIPKLLGRAPETSLTTLLFHRFCLPGETLEASRERLRRQLDWLRRDYSPVTPQQAADVLAGARSPSFPVLVTVDDAHVDFLKVQDLFRSFDVPVLMFVCVGWSDMAGPREPATLLARIVAMLQWGRTLDRDISASKDFPPIRLGEPFKAQRTAVIDRLIARRDELGSDLDELAVQLEQATYADEWKTSCNWNDLKDLARADTVIGCHSASHVALAKASKARMAFEISDARTILCAKFGDCRHFAYPFGTVGSYDAATTAEIVQSGFECAFLTHADFATPRTDRYHLPRFVIPRNTASLSAFRAIVHGGGIALDKAKRLLGIGQHSI